MIDYRRQRGSLMIVTIVMILVLGFMGVAITSMSATSTYNAIDDMAANEAFYLAESGLQRGIREWSLAPSTYAGEGPVNFGNGNFVVAAPVLISATQAQINATATVPTLNGTVSRTISATVDLGGANSIPTDDLADWPTEVLDKTDGTTDIVVDSIRFKTLDIKKARYKGYRETSAASPLITLNAGESVNIDLQYKKTWITGTPDSNEPQKMNVDLELISTTGTSYTIWSENNEFNNPNWLTAPTINWTVPGGVTINRIRLSFNLQRKKRGYIPEVFFREITITSTGIGGGANIISWKENIP